MQLGNNDQQRTGEADGPLMEVYCNERALK